MIYANWLSMVHAGIRSLQMYQSQTSRWLQSHSQARYVITRVLLEAAPELVKIDYIKENPQDSKPDLLITFSNDLNLINSIGKKAISDFLLKLQVYKSLGDIESAKKMFDHYSLVSDNLEYPYLQFRQIAIDRKKPRRLFVESSTKFDSNGQVELQSYESTHEGVIQSFLDHINVKDVDNLIIDLWKKDANYFI